MRFPGLRFLTYTRFARMHLQLNQKQKYGFLALTLSLTNVLVSILNFYWLKKAEKHWLSTLFREKLRYLQYSMVLSSSLRVLFSGLFFFADESYQPFMQRFKPYQERAMAPAEC